MAKKNSGGENGTNGTTGKVTEFRVPEVKLKKFAQQVKDHTDAWVDGVRNSVQNLPAVGNLDDWALHRGLSEQGLKWATMCGMQVGFTLRMLRDCGLSKEDSLIYLHKMIDFVRDCEV